MEEINNDRDRNEICNCQNIIQPTHLFFYKKTMEATQNITEDEKCMLPRAASLGHFHPKTPP